MKKRRVVKHERALRDLELRSEYIRQHNPRAALRFLNAAEATIRQLAASPGIGTRYDSDHPALAELRYLPITRFKNDLVFYRFKADLWVQLFRGKLHRLFGLAAKNPN